MPKPPAMTHGAVLFDGETKVSGACFGFTLLSMIWAPESELDGPEVDEDFEAAPAAALEAEPAEASVPANAEPDTPSRNSAATAAVILTYMNSPFTFWACARLEIRVEAAIEFSTAAPIVIPYLDGQSYHCFCSYSLLPVMAGAGRGLDVRAAAGRTVGGRARDGVTRRLAVAGRVQRAVRAGQDAALVAFGGRDVAVADARAGRTRRMVADGAGHCTP